MRQELLFLLHTARKLHHNDYAYTLYHRVIEALLMIDERKAIEFIENIEQGDDMVDVSSHFSSLVGEFENKGFMNRLETAAKRFKDVEDYSFILRNIDKSKELLENIEKSNQNDL